MEEGANKMPALGISLLLIAIGAVLAFALNTTSNTAGVEVETIGVILMVVGGIGILMSLLFLMSFSPFGSHDSHTSTHIDA
jgi:hypothetical protein